MPTYIRPRTSLAAIALVVALVLAPACARRSPTLTPTQNVQLTIDQGLNALAHSAKLAEKLATQLNASKTITDSQARPVMLYAKEAADVARELQNANLPNLPPSQRATAILTALGKITQLPPDVAALVNNSATSDSVRNLVVLIQNIIAATRSLIGNANALSVSVATPGGNQ